MDNTDPNNPNSNFSGINPPPPDQPVQNPWDLPTIPPPSTDLGNNPIADPMTIPPAQTASPPMPEPSWPSSNALPETNIGSASQQPQAPADFTQQSAGGATNPPTSNPFVQNQDGSASSPIASNSFAPNLESPQQDPLNTAFTPSPNPSEPNPFSAIGNPIPTSPGIPTDPLTQLAQSIPPGGSQPESFQQNPIAQTPPGEIPATNTASALPTEEGNNQPIPPSSSQDALDLSSPQTNPIPQQGNAPIQPGNPLPETEPVENAPTDLSHLIAGEETDQKPGEIYNPPVASEQTPGLNSTQPQASSENGAPPAEKHLNLTKVLLVAGIPIILIVAALSAYLILGVGKSSPESTNQTSLPIEQTQTNQAPLTNPPQQIVAPSLDVNPEPLASTENLESSQSSTLPKSSSSPTSVLEQLKARQAASSSPSASTNSNR